MATRLVGADHAGLAIGPEGSQSVTFKVPTYGYGIIPVGAVVAIASTVAWSLPVSGQIKEGFALCNGQAFPSGSDPLFIGNMPNLTDDRFLQGSSTTGTTGGSNTYSLQSSLGTIDFSHGHTVNSHSHDMRHNHQWSNNYSGDNYTRNTSDYNTVGIPTQVAWSLSEYSPSGIDDIGEAGITRNPDYYYTSGVYSGINGNGSGANTGGTNPGTNSPTLQYSAGHGHNILNSSGTTTTDLRPKYFNVIYIMRVK